jgi:hypothetical protein
VNVVPSEVGAISFGSMLGSTGTMSLGQMTVGASTPTRGSSAFFGPGNQQEFDHHHMRHIG